jgi:anti-anti-sigma regulatory factor
MTDRTSARDYEEIQLIGYVDLPSISPVVDSIWRSRRQRSQVVYILDCSSVTEISSGALVELLTLQQELQAEGSDLAVVNCLRTIQAMFEDRPLQVRIDEPKANQPHVPKGVQQAIRYISGREFAYYWLN